MGLLTQFVLYGPPEFLLVETAVTINYREVSGALNADVVSSKSGREYGSNFVTAINAPKSTQNLYLGEPS
jgi:intergrase/recombinase